MFPPQLAWTSSKMDRSFALADFDHDGRLEVFLKNRNAPQLRMLKNVCKTSAAFDRISPARAQRAIVTRSAHVITIETGAGQQTRMLQAGSGFLSQHSKDVFFGLGRGREAQCARRFAGPAASCKNCTISPSITGSGWKKALNPRAWKPFNTRVAKQTAPPYESSPEIELLPTDVETWLLAPVAAPDFSLPDLSGQVRTLSSHARQACASEFLEREVGRCAGRAENASEVPR